MKYGEGRKQHARNPAHVYRDAEMILLFRDGQTLQQIGVRYGVTREYVRQRVTKWGLTKEDGGYAIQSFLKVRARADAKVCRVDIRERRIQAKYGLTVADWQSIGAKGREAYRYQRYNAKRRGIPWNFTLASWWSLWQESGRWAERGRGKGYCMARWGDSGPYSPENVYICTIGQNFKDSYLIHSAEARTAKRRANAALKEAA